MTLSTVRQQYTMSLLSMTWQETWQQAQILVRSGLLPKAVNTPEKAVAIMYAAREIGVGPMEGFGGIHVIDGKPTISPRLQLALIYRSGLLEDIQIDEKPDQCTVTMKRRGCAPFTATFTMEDAQRAELRGKDNWKKYGSNMLRWRAVGYAADVVFPDVTGGMYRPDELGAITNAEGDVVQHDAVTGEVVPSVVRAVRTVDDKKTIIRNLYARTVPRFYKDAEEWKGVVYSTWGASSLLDLSDEQLDEWSGRLLNLEAAADQHISGSRTSALKDRLRQSASISSQSPRQDENSPPEWTDTPPASEPATPPPASSSAAPDGGMSEETKRRLQCALTSLDLDIGDWPPFCSGYAGRKLQSICEMSEEEAAVVIQRAREVAAV